MDAWLKRLTASDFELVLPLRLTEQDEAFAGDLEEVFQDLRAQDHEGKHPFAVFSGQMPVGFLVLKEGSKRPQWALSNTLTLHNFRIGAAHQGRGHGRRAIDLVGEWIRQNRPGTRGLMLSVNLRNERARQFYLQCGFAETGSLCQGRLGPQHILLLEL